MASRTNHIDQHVGELLSGYIDGELTQQERQRVDVHCESCAECGQLRDELREIRRDVGDARLSEIGEDNWREMMNDSTVRVTRGIALDRRLPGRCGHRDLRVFDRPISGLD
jgi:anti-sigma factor RsiW